MVRSLALYLAWVVVGFIASFALLYGFTPVGPAIFLVVWLGYRFLPRVGGRRRPEAYGALAGFGMFWLLIGSTADTDAALFTAVGSMAVVAATLSYLVVGRSRCKGSAAVG
jgi:hypothetical protein